MQRENPLHAFALAVAADVKHPFKPMPPRANNHPEKNLYAFFVPFDHFGMHTHSITDAEVRGVFAKLFRLNFIK